MRSLVDWSMEGRDSREISPAVSSEKEKRTTKEDGRPQSAEKKSSSREVCSRAKPKLTQIEIFQRLDPQDIW